MAELVDALGSGPSVLTDIGVQVSFRVFKLNFSGTEMHLFCAFFIFSLRIINKIINNRKSIPRKMTADLMSVAVCNCTLN